MIKSAPEVESLTLAITGAVPYSHTGWRISVDGDSTAFVVVQRRGGDLSLDLTAVFDGYQLQLL